MKTHLTTSALALAVLLVASCGGTSADPTPTLAPADTATALPTNTQPPTETPEPNAETSIASKDGMAKLFIPAGALPEGMSASDIRLVPVRGSIPEGDLQVLVAYELTPDGLQLSQPATLDIAIPAGLTETDLAEALLIAFHLSGDTVEFPPLELVVDETTGSTVLRVELTHFSEIIISHAEQWIQAQGSKHREHNLGIGDADIRVLISRESVTKTLQEPFSLYVGQGQIAGISGFRSFQYGNLIKVQAVHSDGNIGIFKDHHAGLYALHMTVI